MPCKGDTSFVPLRPCKATLSCAPVGARQFVCLRGCAGAHVGSFCPPNPKKMEKKCSVGVQSPPEFGSPAGHSGWRKASIAGVPGACVKNTAPLLHPAAVPVRRFAAGKNRRSPKKRNKKIRCVEADFLFHGAQSLPRTPLAAGHATGLQRPQLATGPLPAPLQVHYSKGG
jgi:hypothetical protein